MLEHAFTALAALLAPGTFVLLALGVFAGLIAGAIPGFTITMAVILTLPFTFGMPPIQGLATMIGVFVGGLSGGLIAGILTGIPGTPSSIATTFDGHPMAKKGEPGLALGIGVWASFFGGVISASLLMTMAPVLAAIGLEFGPWDLFALMIFALTITTSLAGEDMVKGLISGMVGLLVTCVGQDQTAGIARFTFGVDALGKGFPFLAVLVGLFAFSQLLRDVRDADDARQPLSLGGGSRVTIEHIKAIKIVLRKWRITIHAALTGVFIGVLPAAGASVSNILAYDQIKKASPYPEKFGTGIPDGVIASEASNNATAGGDIMTTIALGIPGDVVTAILLGALIMHNVAPSPTFISAQPVLAYSIMISYLLAHVVMVALQAGCLRIFALVTRVPMYHLVGVVLFYCAVGVFTLNNIVWDVWVLFGFGVLGYLMHVFKFPLTPMILGVVLGDQAEINLVRALATEDSLLPFVTRPWSLFFLIIAFFSLIFPWYQDARARAHWTLCYTPFLALFAAVPFFMMDDVLRAIIGAGLVAVGLWLLWQHHRRGWALPATPSVVSLHE
ncbi:MAG: tripartite tricarboxylate transporter permease [Acidimicrobiia bacterium]|nr:tripartite tricarboxylate transporter permease [Acidimicrobiia bacterium]